jgi:Skp family chaperone for outer membrane proteins
LGRQTERSRRAAGLLRALALGLALGAPATAQDAPVKQFLIINQERLLTGSRTGQEVLQAEEVERDRLRSEARALDSSFEAEEQKLTDQRATLPPEEFRTLADAFDARVVTARRDQDKRASALAQDFEQRRRQFYARVAPILVSLMDRYQALAIFDETSVLVADQSLNITDAVIAEIDAAPGGSPPPAADPAAPPATDLPVVPAPEAPLPDVLMPRPPLVQEPSLVLPPRRNGPLTAPVGNAPEGGE